MNEKTAWQRFEKNGSVEDYLAYKNCVNLAQNNKGTEKESVGENLGSGACNTGADRRGVR